MIVIDASVWVVALVDRGRAGEACRQVIAADIDWLAPPHAALEALRTIRRLELARSLTPESAKVHAAAITAADVRYASPDRDLLEASWELRHNISLYDAPYVVLAAMYACPLVTGDKRLATAARAKGVHVIEPGAQES